MKPISIIIIFFFSAHAVLWAQEPCVQNLRGKVIDAKTQKGLIGATIQIQNDTKGAVTDLEGDFVVRGLCPETYVFEINYIGYETLIRKINTSRAENIIFQLTEDILLLETIVVEVKEENTETRSNQTVGKEEMDASRGKSLGESLKSITGVTSLQTGPTISKPVIHGLHSNRVLILNNGIRQEGQQWGSEHAPEIDPFIASEITVVKGADAVRYGSDAIAGMILVEPAKLHQNIKLGGDVNLGYLSNSRGYFGSALVEGGSKRIEALAWRVQGTGKYFGDSKAPDYNLSNTGLRELDFSGAIGYYKDKFNAELYVSRFETELAILSASHIGNLTDLEEALESDVPLIIEPFTYEIIAPRQHVVHNLIKFNAHKRGDKGRIEFQYGGQVNDREEYDIRRSSQDDRPSMALKLYSHLFDINWESLSNKRFSTKIGANASFQENDNVPGTGVKPLIPDYDKSSVGLFVIEKYLREKWILEAGLRYDYQLLEVFTFDNSANLLTPEYQFSNFAATVGFEYEFNSTFKYSTNASTAFRPPHVSELFSQGLHHGTASIEEGLFIENGELIDGFEDANPPSETAIKWIHSFQFQKSGWEIELSPYFSRISNFIFLEPQQELRLTIRGAFPVFDYKRTEARFSGYDLALNYHFSDEWEVKFKNSMVRGWNKDINDWLIFMPADRYELSLHFEKEELGKLGDFHLSLGALQVMEQTRVPPESDYKAPPPSYFLLNFHAGFAFKIGGEHFNIYMNLDNLLNTTYRDYLNRFRYYADDIGRNLTIRLKYDFHSHK